MAARIARPTGEPVKGRRAVPSSAGWAPDTAADLAAFQRRTQSSLVGEGKIHDTRDRQFLAKAEAAVASAGALVAHSTAAERKRQCNPVTEKERELNMKVQEEVGAEQTQVRSELKQLTNKRRRTG